MTLNLQMQVVCMDYAGIVQTGNSACSGSAKKGYGTARSIADPLVGSVKGE